MKGNDYIALVRISNAADDTLAEPGARCDAVPEDALDWLVNAGAIRLEPAPTPVEPVLTRARRREAAESTPDKPAGE